MGRSNAAALAQGVGGGVAGGGVDGIGQRRRTKRRRTASHPARGGTFTVHHQVERLARDVVGAHHARPADGRVERVAQREVGQDVGQVVRPYLLTAGGVKR